MAQGAAEGGGDGVPVGGVRAGQVVFAAVVAWLREDDHGGGRNVARVDEAGPLLSGGFRELVAVADAAPEHLVVVLHEPVGPQDRPVQAAGAHGVLGLAQRVVALPGTEPGLQDDAFHARLLHDVQGTFQGLCVHGFRDDQVHALHSGRGRADAGLVAEVEVRGVRAGRERRFLRMAGSGADLLSGIQKLGHEFAPDVPGGGSDENHDLTVGAGAHQPEVRMPV